MIQTKIITLVTLHFTLTDKDLHIIHVVTQLYPSTTLVTFQFLSQFTYYTVLHIRYYNYVTIIYLDNNYLILITPIT